MQQLQQNITYTYRTQNGEAFIRREYNNTTLYSSPYLVATNKGYTKHYYAESERIASKIGGGLQGLHTLCGGVDEESFSARKDSAMLHVKRIADCLGFEIMEMAENKLVVLDQPHGTDTDPFYEDECYWYHPDHLGSASWVSDKAGKGIQHLYYLPWGEELDNQRATDYASRYTFSGKERDEGTGYSYFGARYYNSDLSIWLSVDPLADKYPGTSPYTYCANNPVRLVDPDGREIGDYYNWYGKHLGADNIADGKVYVATGKREVVNSDGTHTTIFDNAIDLGINHTQFCTIANIIKQESSHGSNEDLWIAHTANNAAKKSNMSLYAKLMSGYSCVPDKSPLSPTALSANDNSARAAAINVLTGGADPTGGATLWDGVDFLAWGLQGPKSRSHAKFRQYCSITIPSTIYQSYLNNVTARYGSFVSYYNEKYAIPAAVFKDEKNWDNNVFQYNTGTNTGKSIEAVGNCGRTIFWKVN